MNRTYELMFIVRPDMTDEDQDKLISTLEHAVTSSDGQVKNVEKMGKRRLRVSEAVIKFLSVRIDEEQKRLDKIKAIRDARKKKSTSPVPSAEGAEAPAVTA